MSGAVSSDFGGAFKGRHVLVTGHTGFKGGWISHWLMQLGARVSGIALAPEPGPNLCDATGLTRGHGQPPDRHSGSGRPA